MLLLVVACIVIVVVVAWGYCNHKHVPPTLHHSDTDLNRHILKTKPRFTSPYRLPFWLRNTHLHTTLSWIIKQPVQPYNREFVKMEDGGVVALDWISSHEEKLTDRSPILIILLMWTSCNNRAMPLCKLASERGFRVVIFNKRGHGDVELETPKLQSVGDTADFRTCVDIIHERYPEARLFGHGSSAGCGVEVAYATKRKEECRLSACVYVSPSYDMYRTFSDMPFVYYHFLLLALKVVVWRHREKLGKVVNLREVLMAGDFTTMEKHLYCKFYGYDDLESYRKDHDPLSHAHEANVPCLSISGHDDPVCQTNTVPYHMFLDEKKRERILVTVPKGGHCAFFEGGMSLESWSDKLSIDYLDAVLEHLGEKE